MIKIKLSGAKKSRTIPFKNKFNELSTATFCKFIEKEEELSDLETKLDLLDQELRDLPIQAPNITTLVIVLDSDINDTERKIRALKIELLGLLSNDYTRTVNFIINTIGITERLVNSALLAIHNSMGDFDAWAKKVPMVDKFKFSDYKRPSFFSISKVREFQVFDSASNTVLRDSAASIVARKVDSIEKEFEANRWSNLPRFLAYVCRPAIEKEEICTQDKKAFFGGASVKTLGVDDRLKAYNDLLANMVDLRTPLFAKLPLSIAIGVYKQYFFLSRR